MSSYSLITGASSGIGLELARIAAADGRDLILVARSADKLRRIRQELMDKSSVEVEVFVADLSKPGSGQALYDFCSENKLVIDCLINNAGFGDYGEFAKSDLSKQMDMIDLNVRTLTELTHLFVKDMVNRGKGQIMNVGSVASFIPGPMMSVYFATKNYVLAFSEAIAVELKGAGVSVTCLCPGATKTGFGEQAHVSKTHSVSTTHVTPFQVAGFGWKAMNKGKVIAVYGVQNRLMIALGGLLPRSLTRQIVARIQK